MGILQGTLSADGENDILGRWQEIPIKPKELADDPLHAVAFNRLLHTMDAYTKSIKTELVIDINQAEMGAPYPLSLSINDTVLFRLSQEGGFWQFKTHGNCGGILQALPSGRT